MQNGYKLYTYLPSNVDICMCCVYIGETITEMKSIKLVFKIVKQESSYCSSDMFFFGFRMKYNKMLKKMIHLFSLSLKYKLNFFHTILNNNNNTISTTERSERKYTM